MFSSTIASFLRGLLSGLSAPMTGFAPPAVHTTVDSWVTTPSYRPPSEDWENIHQDFAKVIGAVDREVNTTRRQANNQQKGRHSR